MGFVSSVSRKKIWAGVLDTVNQQLEVGYGQQNNKKKLPLLPIHVEQNSVRENRRGRSNKRQTDGWVEGWMNGWIGGWMDR